jgi:hypothetical protein
MDAPDTRTAARVALGRIRLNQGQPVFALELAAQAQAQDPKALPPVLLALDVMNRPATARRRAPRRTAAPSAQRARERRAPRQGHRVRRPS